jgi:hypothetical protein
MVPQYDSSEFHLEKLQANQLSQMWPKRRKWATIACIINQHFISVTISIENESNKNTIQSKALSDLSLLYSYCIANKLSSYHYSNVTTVWKDRKIVCWQCKKSIKVIDLKVFLCSMSLLDSFSMVTVTINMAYTCDADLYLTAYHTHSISSHSLLTIT